MQPQPLLPSALVSLGPKCQRSEQGIDQNGGLRPIYWANVPLILGLGDRVCGDAEEATPLGSDRFGVGTGTRVLGLGIAARDRMGATLQF